MSIEQRNPQDRKCTSCVRNEAVAAISFGSAVINLCESCRKQSIKVLVGSVDEPYSKEDYENAKQVGLDLDNWNHYVKYFDLGKEFND